MKKVGHFFLAILGLFLVFGCANKLKNVDINPKAIVQHDPKKVFEQFWETSKSHIYPKDLEAKYFTSSEYAALEKNAEESSDIYELAPLLNQFLKKLGVSHTQFYTDRDFEFNFFRSLFSTRDPNSPSALHIGADYEKTTSGFVIRSTLDGFDAKQAGLRRGDLILEAEGKPFDPISSFSTTAEVQLSILRAKKMIKLTVRPSLTGIHRAYLTAIKNSVKVIESGKKKIGYIHLWTGTHDDSVSELQNAVKLLKDTDAMILDLRDGYGGAWWHHLDPFFPNTDNYFKATWIDRDGQTSDMRPEVKENPAAYTKPMVVLINEGVRSGKEALAFQFKKTKRALLVGTKTAGYFVAGGAYFREPELPYFLYLSSRGLLLDGTNLEGNGVRPDLEVAYPLDSTIKNDPQLEKALHILR